MIIDEFKTYDGWDFNLYKNDASGEYEIRRNDFVFHRCDTMEMATEKFYRIKELFRMDGQLAI